MSNVKWIVSRYRVSIDSNLNGRGVRHQAVLVCLVGEVPEDAGGVVEPDGRVRARAKKGTFGVHPNPSQGETTTSTSFTELPTIHFVTDEEAWKIFDEAARRYLKISGKKFLQKWDKGEYPDPDAEGGVMSVAMLIPTVRRSVPQQ